MNKQHKNIQFTFENEINDEIPFLDVFVKRKDHRFYTSQYFKKTDSRLYFTQGILKPLLLVVLDFTPNISNERRNL